LIFILVLATIALLIDQITKALVLTNLALGESATVIPNILDFTRVHNTGVAFGLFRDANSLSILCVVIGCILLMFIILNLKHASVAQKIAGSLIIGGAVGNIIDRIRFGAVIDFIDFKIWPVFNIADTCISIAAGIFVISILIKRK